MTELPSPENRLAAALPREHVLVALSRAQDQLAGLVDAVESSTDTDQAQQRVRALLDLDEAQATAVLDMQVRRMSATERARVRDELEQLRGEIEDLRTGR
jgi:DNA gyrase subunit A